MMRTLFGRTLFDKRWFFVGWSVVFAVTSTLILMFYPSFSQNGGFDEVAKTLPSQLQGFIGDPNVFRTIDGFIASQIFDIRMSLMIIIMTLVLAVGLTVKEEENGDMRTMLATSLSRSRMVFEKLLAALTIIIGLNLVTVAGIYVGVMSLGETAPHSLIWKLFGLSCLFGAAAFALPFSIALATGRRSITMTVGLIIAIGSYILSTFARNVEWLRGWDHLSLMHYYDTASVRNGDFNQLNAWILVAISVTAIVLALTVFRRRDIS